MWTWSGLTSCLSTLQVSRMGYWPSISIRKVPTIPSVAASTSTWRVHITAGGIRHDLLEQAQTLSEEQLQNIEGSFRLSEEIAHQGIATATPSFSQRLQSFGYSLVSPDTTPNRNLFDRE